MSAQIPSGLCQAPHEVREALVLASALGCRRVSEAKASLRAERLIDQIDTVEIESGQLS